MNGIFRFRRRRSRMGVYVLAILASVAFLSLVFCKDEAGSKKVYLLKINSDYDPIMANYVTRGVKEAETEQASLIIIELNTPGGRGDSMWEINDALLSSRIPTLAWVNKDAASAGGATAISCNNIVMARGGTFGAVVPIIPVPMGEPIELGPKFVSYMKKQMASAAEANDYYPRLAAAMTDKRMEISYLEYWEWADANKVKLQEKGFKIDDIPQKLAQYREMEQKYKKEWETKKGISPTTVPPSIPPYSVSLWDDITDTKSKEVEDIKPRERDWRDELGDKWFISTNTQPVTLSTAEAIDLKIALAEVNSIDEIFKVEKYKYLEGARIIEIDKSWSEKFAKFLVPFRGLLLIFGIIGVATEIKVPGFGAPGILGITCLALFFFVNFGYSMAEWINIALFMVGLILLAVEIFLIPGFGVTGISGIILMVVGIFLTLLKNPMPDLPVPGVVISKTLVELSVYLVGTFIVMMLLFRYVLPHTPIYSRIILTSREDKSKGFHASEGSPLADGVSLVGKTGVSLSTLRPAGKAMFGGIRYDVITDGDMIGNNEKIEIIEVKGNRIVVRKVKDSGKGV